MLEVIKDKLSRYPDKGHQYNYLREYLQELILKIIDEQGLFRNIAFLGGTALRIIYGLNRFSEDLDFSLVNKKNYDLSKFSEKLASEFDKLNLPVVLKCSPEKTVANIKIKFTNILFALGLSQHKDQVLMLKLEIDQNPPSDFNTEFTLINKEFLINVNHFDLPSLFAGKLHAVLFRKYTKGRDYYDLFWFLGKGIRQNYAFLNAAIEQSQHEDLHLDREKLKILLEEKIATLDFTKVANDVSAFLEDVNEKRFFTYDVFKAALKNL